MNGWTGPVTLEEVCATEDALRAQGCQIWDGPVTLEEICAEGDVVHHAQDCLPWDELKLAIAGLIDFDALEERRP